MKIDTIRELESVLKLCHKQGVRSITIDGITMAIGELPEPKSVKELKSEQPSNASDYSDDDLLLWSAAPRVG